MPRPSTLASLLLAAAAGAALVTFARPAPAAAPAPGWQYLIVRGVSINLAAPPATQDEQVAAAQSQLNQLGGDGWELQLIQGEHAVLRRPR